MSKRASLAERFWAKVDKRGADECWPWTASVDLHGYGRLYGGEYYGSWRPAHRVSWELNKGAIPHGMRVLHRCDNRRCVNPGHLFLGTQKNNIEDMVAKGRGLIGEANGHAKLTSRQVAEIKAAKGTQRAIAARFNVHQVHVGRIRRGERRARG